MSLAYIGMGANLGSPIKTLQNASIEIKKLGTIIGQSHLYQSKAIGPDDQPDYINAVIALETALTPLALLAALQNIEQEFGRERLIRWGARTLDLDIILFDNINIDTEKLTIPHRELHNRNFVLLPLMDIAPMLTLPNGDKLANLENSHNHKDITPLDYYWS